MSNDLIVYDDHADKHERAWKAFNRIYLLERPEPSSVRWYHGLPWMMLPFGIISIAGILLSAMRTAPVFYQVAVPLVGEGFGVLEALFAIITVEVFVVMVRYAMIILNPDKTHDIGRWMIGGFIVALTVALAANLYGSISHLEALRPHKPNIDLIMGIVVGVSAPLFAVISGDILGILWTRSSANRSQLKREFEDAMREWRDKRENSWNSKKSDYGIRIHVPNLPSNSNGNSNGKTLESGRAGSSIGHSKNVRAREIVEQYFDTYAEALEQDPLEIAAFLEVGKSTVYVVRAERKARR